MKNKKRFDKNEECVCCEEDISCKKCGCDELEIEIKHEKENVEQVD
jgi:hypothetical protein